MRNRDLGAVRGALDQMVELVGRWERSYPRAAEVMRELFTRRWGDPGSGEELEFNDRTSYTAWKAENLSDWHVPTREEVRKIRERSWDPLFTMAREDRINLGELPFIWWDVFYFGDRVYALLAKGKSRCLVCGEWISRESRALDFRHSGQSQAHLSCLTKAVAAAKRTLDGAGGG